MTSRHCSSQSSIVLRKGIKATISSLRNYRVSYQLNFSMALTQETLAMCQVMARVFGPISIVCCLFVIITYFTWKRFRIPSNRLLVIMISYLLIGEIGASMGNLLLTDPVGCKIQGFMIQVGYSTSMLWTAFMANNLLLAIRFKFTIDD